MTKAQVYGFPLHSILQICIVYKEYYAVSSSLSHEITDEGFHLYCAGNATSTVAVEATGQRDWDGRACAKACK